MNEPDQKVLQVEMVDAPAPPCPFPYFLVAYYQGRWSIRRDMWGGPDAAGLKSEIASLQEKGWSHVKICRLPL